ncbi:MAG TPA: ATP-binding protein [Allosphingosinicella sp.]|nr:ATP-binding protein [Allosphingosinicella sp.]
MAELATAVSPLEAARQFAALSGPFDPVQALPAALAETPDEAALVASELAAACDTHPPEASGKWLLRTPERRSVLHSLHEAGALSGEIAAHRARATDAPTRDLLEALLGEGRFALAAIGREIDAPTSCEHLERLIVALDRAGDIAPGYSLLDTLRATLALLHRRTRWRRLEESGVFGRDDERRAIDAWLANPILDAPVRALYVRGAPGIGKSILLDDSVRQAYERLAPLIIRLDFDRAGLDVQDVVGLTMEVARQIAEQIGREGPALLRERLSAASVGARPTEKSTASIRSQMPAALATAIGKAVRESGRPVLVLLDTLEVLRYRGETHPESLFRWLDGLVGFGLRPLRVLAAGRGGALDDYPNRVGTPIELKGLPEPAADSMLDALEVPAHLRDEVIELAGGNPLVLRLAGEIVRRAGAQALPKRGRKQIAADFLYRFLVSRIDDPVLKKIVHPGLVLRRISAETIAEVVAPALRLGPIAPAEAVRLWKDLAAQTWLVERDPTVPGFLRPRFDMRALLLPLFYRDQPGRSARIDEAAVRWFGRRPDSWCQVESAYHRLQLMRRQPSPPPLIERDVAAQIDPDMLAELPTIAQDLVRTTRGDRSTQFRQATTGLLAGDDSTLARELVGIIERQDWIEGEHVIRDVIDTAGISARSEAADAIRAFSWRSGRWSRARRLLQDRDRLVTGDYDIRELPMVLALARLEMRAEFEPRAFVRWLGEDERNASLAGESTIGSMDDIGRLGALGFILEARGEGVYRGGRPEQADPTKAAATYWRESGESGSIMPTLRDAHERMQSRSAAAVDGPGTHPAAVARLLAIYNPYASVALNLSVDPDLPWIAAAAKAGDWALAEAGALLPWESRPVSRSGRDHPISGLARLGLFAEWVQAVAWLTGDPDLRLIGRSAEAWRRTTSGQWRYGRPPPGWAEQEPLDATLAERLKSICRSRDPHHAAMLQLGLWSAHPEASGDEVWRRLRKKLDGVAAPQGDSMEALVAAAQHLLRRRVPSAFVPAAAYLLVRGDS